MWWVLFENFIHYIFSIEQRFGCKLFGKVLCWIIYDMHVQIEKCTFRCSTISYFLINWDKVSITKYLRDLNSKFPVFIAENHLHFYVIKDGMDNSRRLLVYFFKHKNCHSVLVTLHMCVWYAICTFGGYWRDCDRHRCRARGLRYTSQYMCARTSSIWHHFATESAIYTQIAARSRGSAQRGGDG